MSISVHPETLKAAWARAREGFAEVSPEGVLRNVNRYFAAIVGYSPAELHEKTFQQITHPDDVHYDAEMVNQVLSGKVESYPMTKRYLTKDNDVVWVRLIVSGVDVDGETRLLLGQVQVLDRNHLNVPQVMAPDPMDLLKKHWKKVVGFMTTVTTGIATGLYYLKEQAAAQEAQAQQIEQLKTLLEALVK